ncbi:MAG TPA: Mur ligase family protein [Candidatus Saccharimonadales bacterium]
MRSKFKAIILKKLQQRTKEFLAAHTQLKLIAVAGSVGKTSTRNAITTVLSSRLRVLSHSENHNMEMSVPLAIMDIPYPEKVRSFFAWWRVLRMAKKRIKRAFAYDVIVIELASDQPGDIMGFSSYLNPDISVITAVAPEHMIAFKTIDAVATEELSTGNFSKLVAINRDDIDGRYAEYLKTDSLDTYGMSGVAEYHFLVEKTTADGYCEGKLVTPEFGEQQMTLHVLGEQGVKAVIAGVLVGTKLGLTAAEVKQGAEAVRPVAGRMQPLRGLLSSLIIDDTYNSSPLAAKAALQVLYSFAARPRIAILGSMNALGDISKAAHEELGRACDPTMLDWVITVGSEAEKYLAPAALAKGCQVKSFKTALDAGAFAHSVLRANSVVLVKGSQDGIFTEEAVKILLHSTEDEKKLVRQSRAWLAHKQTFFSKFQ